MYADVYKLLIPAFDEKYAAYRAVQYFYNVKDDERSYTRVRVFNSRVDSLPIDSVFVAVKHAMSDTSFNYILTVNKTHVNVYRMKYAKGDCHV
jgi:hypothetical protein